MRYCRSTQQEREPSNPLISVIIPTFNRCELLLERALPSVLGQTYKKLEIIIAAHGCTDGTAEKAYQFWLGNAPLGMCFHGDAFRKPIDVPRTETYPPTAENHWLAGPVKPLNAALEAVRGDWIARIDDDDVWTPDHLEKLLEFAQAGDYEFVSSAYRTHDGVVPPYLLPDSPNSFAFASLYGTLVGGTQTWLYRSYLKFMKYNPDCWRKAWNRVNDVDLQDRMFRAGVRMGYLDTVTAYVYPRPGETQVGSKAYLEDTIKKERELSFG